MKKEREDLIRAKTKLERTERFTIPVTYLQYYPSGYQGVGGCHPPRFSPSQTCFSRNIILTFQVAVGDTFAHFEVQIVMVSHTLKSNTRNSLGTTPKFVDCSSFIIISGREAIMPLFRGNVGLCNCLLTYLSFENWNTHSLCENIFIMGWCRC